MKTYSDGVLATMLADPESDRVERKESLKGGAPQAVRAFANDLAGHGEPGVVFVGVGDDGTPTGLEISDELLRQLADIKSDGNIVPPPSLLVEKRSLGGHDVAVITVWPCHTPSRALQGTNPCTLGAEARLG